jgi:hypothetical protein
MFLFTEEGFREIDLMYGNFNLVGVIHELPLHAHPRFLSAGSIVLD